MSFGCQWSRGSSGISVKAPVGQDLGMNAVGIPGMACEERVAAVAACCACTWRPEMDRCCARAGVFVGIMHLHSGLAVL